MKNKEKGFTLIEIMIVVLIIGLLYTIAIPSYQDYILRSKLTEGIGAVSIMKVKMEQHFQEKRTYEGACEADSLASIPGELDKFTVECSDLTAKTYNIKVSGEGFEYTINQANEKATTQVPNGWTTSDKCWVTNKNGQCN